jgi:hypothetical protein
MEGESWSAERRWSAWAVGFPYSYAPLRKTNDVSKRWHCYDEQHRPEPYPLTSSPISVGDDMSLINAGRTIFENASALRGRSLQRGLRECMGTPTKEQKSACNSYCANRKRDGETGCVLGCGFRWDPNGGGCILTATCGFGENCPDIEDPEEVEMPTLFD